MSHPMIAVTMGDPAGIGPEIVVKALGEPEVRGCCQPIVVGDPAIMTRAAALVQSPLRIRIVHTLRGAGADSGTIDVLPEGQLPPDTLKPGTLDARWGECAAACCRRAVALAKAGEVGAIVSTPPSTKKPSTWPATRPWTT